MSHADTWIDDSAVAPAVPRVGGRYDLLALIGEGSMGTVYRARDAELDDLVALKILKRAEDPRVLARARLEVKLARRVTHPNVVRTFDLDEQDGVRFVTMELLDGGSLAERIADHGPLPPREARVVATGLCRGLHAAHQVGVVHRDVKPANVMLGLPGEGGLPRRVAIGDFGIAASFGSRGRDGSPKYMAPEQEGGDPVDARTDLFAVGRVILEMLGGEGCPELVAIAARCLAPEPSDRFPSALELLEALQRSTNHDVQVKPRPARPSARSRVLVVRPFVPPDDADAWLGRSLAAELGERLERSAGLRVRHGRSDEGTDAIVEGRLARDGDGLALRLHLTGVRDGFRLLDLPFRFPEAGTAEVLEAAARRVAAALNGDLPASSALPADPSVLGALLRAREGLRAGWWLGELSRVRAELDALVAKAPSEPMVWSTDALLRAREAFHSADADTVARLLREARAAARRALDADPASGEAWLARALVDLYGGDAEHAARSLVEAAACAPGNPKVQTLIGGLLLEVGDLDGAERHLDAAIGADPLNADARSERARLAAYRGDWPGVVEHTTATSPVGTYTLRVRLLMWSPDAPVPPPLPEATVQDLEARMPGLVRSHRVLEAVVRHPSPELATLLDIPRSTPNPRLRAAQFQIAAECAVRIGELDAARRHVLASIQAGCVDLQWIERCPALAPLRDLPGWADLHQAIAARAAGVRMALEAS